MGQLFALIQLFLKVMNLWEGFLDHVDAQYSKEMQERKQRREKAIEDSKKAETDDEIWDSQDRIVDNKPRP